MIYFIKKSNIKKSKFSKSNLYFTEITQNTLKKDLKIILNLFIHSWMNEWN